MAKKTTPEVEADSFKLHEKDTGSVEVQVVLLTTEITELQAHLALHKKDFDAKRSLLKKVAKRRIFLKYLKAKKLSTYNALSKQVSVRV